LSKLTLKQFLNALENELLVGKTYLAIAKGFLAAEPGVFGVAPTFFGLTAEAGVTLAQMAVARLYDRDGRAVTVDSMLDQAARQAGAFKKGDRGEVRGALANSRREVRALKPVLDSIRHRRNERLAHLDQETVRNPKALANKARLTIEDLDRVFEKTENIVRELQRLLDGTIGPIKFLGDDDFSAVFDCIRRSVAAEKKEFGR
jgi:phytoene dehydrogenase-like protein